MDTITNTEINKTKSDQFQLIDIVLNPKKLLRYFIDKAKHPGVQKHSKNLGWMLFGRVGGMIITFIATAYMARNLGPGNYGELSYAISYVAIFGFIASLGVEQILYRDLIKFPEKRDIYMGTVIVIRFLASILAVMACVLSAYLWSSKDVSLLLIFIVSLTYVLGTFQLLSYEFQAEAKAKFPSIVSLCVVFILNILKIAVIVIMYGQGVIYLALVILAEPLLYSIGLLYFRIKSYGTIQYWRFDLDIAKSMLRDSFPLIFASVFFSIYARIDQVMLKHMLSAEYVGLYDAAVRISELCYFVPNIIVGAMFPAIMNAHKTSEALYAERTKKLLLALIASSFILALGITVFSKYLILIVFGAGFIGAIAVLQIYVWSNVWAAINLLAQQILVAENLTKTVTLTLFLGMSCNVILNFLLIPKFGMQGAAFATFISYIIPSFSLILFPKARIMLKKIFTKQN